MPKHSEQDFIIPALRVIGDYPYGCTTDVIKDEITKYIVLSPEDTEPMPSRSKTEESYRQIVGNLISHRSPDFYKYLIVEKVKDIHGNEKNKNLFKLNNDGIKFVSQYKKSQHLTFIDNSFDINPYEDVLNANNSLDVFDSKVIYAVEKNNLNKRMSTDSKIRDMVLKLDNYECQYGKAIGEKHIAGMSADGHPVVHAHHLIPMKAEKYFFPRSLDRPENIVTLCPNCHSVLHHGSYEEKRKILEVLYKKYIDRLNDIEIFISLENLLDKYYR